MRRVVGAVLVCAALVGAPGAVQAGLITDPVGDFIPSFLGPKNPDLDVVAADVQFDGTNFFLHAILNGPVGFTPGGFYVWGFNRGAGTQGFPVIAPGVIFDKVVVLNNNDTTNIAGGKVFHVGNEIFGVIPLSALPSTGFTPLNYQWNLWPRSPAIPNNPDGNVADFAPNNSDAAVSPTPEPASFALLGVGVLGLAGYRWSRRKPTAKA
jgi:hypothetical protein